MSFINKINRFYRVASRQTRITRRIAVGKGEVLSSSAATVIKDNALLCPYASCRRMSYLKSEKNESVEGFIIEDFKEDNIVEVKELMRLHYYSREPMSWMMNFTYEDHKDVLDDSINEWIGKNVSNITRELKTSKIVACNLATIITQLKKDNITSNNDNYNIQARYYLKLDEVLKDSVDFFKKFNVETILQLEFGIVNPNFGRHGLTKLMISECERRGRNKGCQLVTAIASNIISQKIFQKFGYKMERELNFADFKIDGKQILDLSKNLGTTSAMLLFKQL